MEQKHGANYRLPTEGEKHTARPDDMEIYWRVQREHRLAKLREERMSGGIYSDAMHRDYPEE